MISKDLRSLFSITVLLLIIHGIEEMLTGFYAQDSMFLWISSYFTSITQATFFILQFMWWSLLLVACLLISGRKFQIVLLAVFTIIYLFEIHHIYKAITLGGYYPGLVTALPFPIIGYFYIKALQREWGKN